LVVEYRVPVSGHVYRLRLIPQPLARPADLSVRVGRLPGARVRGRLPSFHGPWTTARTVTVQLSSAG
jgi:hypothetical protein